MAIDYGRKRVGLAVSDPLRLFAVGLETVAAADAVAFIQAYHQKEGIERFVIGYPMNLNGEPSQIQPQVDAFISHLSRVLPQIPHTLADERFTSQMALRAMREGGLRKKQRREKGTADKISAVLILQAWLDQHSQSKP